MDKNDFTAACGEVSGLHFPRWNELPEFDIYMDQVIALTERYLRALSPDGRVQLTPSMINNYVKSGALPPPKNKKYNRTHLALLMIICFAKSVMEISAISDLVSQSIAGGDIEASPYRVERDKTACQYCDFKEACHFDPTLKKDKLRFLPAESPARVYEILEEEQDGKEEQA